MSKKKPTRTVSVPKSVGILLVIASFVGLSAHSTLTGDATPIAKAVNSAKSAK